LADPQREAKIKAIEDRFKKFDKEGKGLVPVRISFSSLTPVSLKLVFCFCLPLKCVILILDFKLCGLFKRRWFLF
jgi:hypothetical protein